ncbi:MAG: hypothetical protein ACK4NF_06080 [Planctomycetota bacterium]
MRVTFSSSLLLYYSSFELICCLLLFSCKHERISKKAILDSERVIYNQLFEESEQLLKKNIFFDRKWVNSVYIKRGGQLKLQNVVNITFVKDSVLVETDDATLYRFDKESGDIKWITKLEHPQKSSYFFFDNLLQTNITQYEKLINYYQRCITETEECAKEIEMKGGVKIKDINLQRRIFETRRFELERKIAELRQFFLIYTLRELKLIGIDFYSGAVRITRYLPSLPATRPFFFDGYITYFSSDRNRFVWVNPFDFTEEFQVTIDSVPNFFKILSNHILIQDKNSLKYLDNRKIYWEVELSSQLVDAVNVYDYGFLITSDNELILINLLTGRIEWKALLKIRGEKLLKYGGYLFIKGNDNFQLVDLTTIAKLLQSTEAYYKAGSYYELKTKGVIKNVKRFLFGDRDYLYFLGIDGIVKKYRRDTLEHIEDIDGMAGYQFIWEHGSENVLLYRKPSYLYYFSFSK